MTAPEPAPAAATEAAAQAAYEAWQRARGVPAAIPGGTWNWLDEEVQASWVTAVKAAAPLLYEANYPGLAWLREQWLAEGAKTERERILAEDPAAGVYRLGVTEGAAAEREAIRQAAVDYWIARHAEGGYLPAWLDDLLEARRSRDT